ncbi:MAG: hypothetical protein KBS57_00220, partial [Alistipes sp.]|nr:hypothetical protein [Candidatus Minthomonas equi]
MYQKSKISFFILAVLAVSFSCNSTKPSYNRENLKATWVADTFDGTLADPLRWTVQKFDDNGGLTVNGVCDIGDGNRSWGTCSLKYQAYCCDLSYYGSVKGFFGIPVSAEISRKYAFASSLDSLVALDITEEKINGETVFSDHNRLTMRKLRAKYAVNDSLVGIWQTASRDEEKFETWRMMFENSGRFTFSVQKPSGEWVQIGQGDDKYFLY